MPLIIEPTSFEGVFIIKLDIHDDVRGIFTELYHEEKFRELGTATFFVQDNISTSKKGVLRGLHFQKNHPQAKFIFPLLGMIYDVVVDLRNDSATYGKTAGFLLEIGQGIFVPKGFAHGFLALTDATVLYKCDDFYNPGDESGIIWNDSELTIDWQRLFDEHKIDEPILSQKDKNLPTFSSLKFD